jgi:hypothetical protein
MFGSVAWRSLDTHEARSFAGRVSGLMAVMVGVAVFEMRSGSKDGKASGVAWFYAIAIYAACLATFNKGSNAEAASSRWIAAILAVASVHSVYDYGWSSPPRMTTSCPSSTPTPGSRCWSPSVP